MKDDDECGVIGGMIGRGNDVLGDNLQQYHVVHLKCYLT
jgi:hypothetical protein